MQDKRKLAIEVDNVQKIYKLYDKPSDRLKEAFGFGKKTKHKLHYALKGVSMKIYQGETVGIIGTNGSGKSTILKIITGVLNPTSGRVLVNGREAGLRLTPPWRFDVTGLLQEGANRIEIRVCNTTANIFLSSPTVYRGGTKAGILGPVRIEIAD